MRELPDGLLFVALRFIVQRFQYVLNFLCSPSDSGRRKRRWTAKNYIENRSHRIGTKLYSNKDDSLS
jgi:hypothetical protein